MKTLFLTFLIFSATSVAAEKIVTSEVILSIINNPFNDEHNCQRALSISKGNIEQSACEKALPAAKENCALAINDFIGMYITTIEQSKYVARTLVLCQVWEILGYETITTENGVQYVKRLGGFLP